MGGEVEGPAAWSPIVKGKESLKRCLKRMIAGMGSSTWETELIWLVFVKQKQRRRFRSVFLMVVLAVITMERDSQERKRVALSVRQLSLIESRNKKRFKSNFRSVGEWCQKNWLHHSFSSSINFRRTREVSHGADPGSWADDNLSTAWRCCRASDSDGVETQWSTRQ